ncbi:MAG: PKD domain-containing protein, partial [Gammaproteobacteria bacterium]|nr:PKD domain-containing protein [Gammaproteobacteria bacterium]
GGGGGGDGKEPENKAPTANAGNDQTVIPGATVNLDGSASKDDDGTISFKWEPEQGTTVTLSNAETATPSFTAPDQSVTLTFKLTVTDDDKATAADTVEITVNQPPTANAGDDQTVAAGATVTLDGTGSNDDGTLTYAWAQTGGTTVDDQTFIDRDTATPSFQAPGEDGTLTFQLTVTDDHNETATDTVQVEVIAVAKLSAESRFKSALLTWEEDDDVAISYDLHRYTKPGCDITDPNFAINCEGVTQNNVRPPYGDEDTETLAKDLTNGRMYYFRLEAKKGDTSAFSNQARARPDRWIVKGQVQAIAVADNGEQYIGGLFSQVKLFTGHGVALDANTGQVIGMPFVNGKIHAAASDGDGGWYIGGEFTEVGDVPRNNAAHILADGTVNPNWDIDIDGEVYAIAVGDGTVYIGGRFDWEDEQAIYVNLVSIGTDGTVNSNWTPHVDEPTSASVRALAVRNGTVYVGGNFTAIDEEDRRHLAAIGTNNDGTANVLDWNPDADEPVTSMVVNNDKIYVAGYFTELGKEKHLRLGAIGIDGKVDAKWDPHAEEAVNTLAVSNNIVYVGGWFEEIDGEERNYLAAIEIKKDGSDELLNWAPKVAGGGFNTRINSITISGDTVFVGGLFGGIDGKYRNNLAAFAAADPDDTDGDSVLLDWNPDVNSTVMVLTAQGDTVYGGGNFTSAGGEARNKLAAMSADGDLLPWNPNVDDGAGVYALDISGDTVYAGGYFFKISGETRNHLAAIGTDGMLKDWNLDADNAVTALEIHNGIVYVGGNFRNLNTTSSPTARNRLAAISTDGTVLPWNPNANNRVDAIAVSGGKIYVGGLFKHFDQPNGQISRQHLAAIDINTGDVDENWNPSINGYVGALAVSEGIVYAGGGFTEIGPIGNTQTRNRLAAIGTNTDGTADLLNWHPNIDLEGRGTPFVSTLAVSNNTVYAGGRFDNVGGKPREHLAAIKRSDGTPYEDWKPEVNTGVLALALKNDKVYAGGHFDKSNGETVGSYTVFDARPPEE